MDSLHFYLFHCYDIGIRTKNTRGRRKKEEDEKKNDKYFDASFAETNKIMQMRAHVTKGFDRFSPTKNSKFNIKAHEKDFGMHYDNDGETYLDAAYEYLQSENVEQKGVETLVHFLKDEEYETETIGYDMNVGNIAKCVPYRYNDCVQKFFSFFQADEVNVSSFSVGLR
eukprot:61278_1